MLYFSAIRFVVVNLKCLMSIRRQARVTEKTLLKEPPYDCYNRVKETAEIVFVLYTIFNCSERTKADVSNGECLGFKRYIKKR